MCSRSSSIKSVLHLSSTIILIIKKLYKENGILPSRFSLIEMIDGDLHPHDHMFRVDHE